jgi:hypothetical protein
MKKMSVNGSLADVINVSETPEMSTYKDLHRMNHYIIDFQVTIDGKEIKTGTTGITSRTTDYKPEIVKRSIEAQYRRKTPHANSISVVIVDTKLVSGEDYIRAAKDFLDIK